MAAHYRYLRIWAGLAANLGFALAACQPIQPPSAANPPTPGLSWAVNDTTQHQSAQLAGQLQSAIIYSGSNYIVSVIATSPDGITKLTLSGTGTFFCQNNVVELGTQNPTYPLQVTTPSAPLTPVSLLALFGDPCAGAYRVGGNGGPAIAHNGSTVTFNASVTNASNVTVNGQLTLKIVGSPSPPIPGAI